MELCCKGAFKPPPQHRGKSETNKGCACAGGHALTIPFRMISGPSVWYRNRPPEGPLSIQVRPRSIFSIHLPIHPLQICECIIVWTLCWRCCGDSASREAGGRYPPLNRMLLTNSSMMGQQGMNESEEIVHDSEFLSPHSCSPRSPLHLFSPWAVGPPFLHFPHCFPTEADGGVWRLNEAAPIH